MPLTKPSKWEIAYCTVFHTMASIMVGIVLSAVFKVPYIWLLALIPFITFPIALYLEVMKGK